MLPKHTDDELWELISVVDTGCSQDTRDFDKSVVALFTSKQLAQQYINNSRLKSGNGFKKRSLLKHADFAEIEKHTLLSVPIDPGLCVSFT